MAGYIHIRRTCYAREMGFCLPLHADLHSCRDPRPVPLRKQAKEIDILEKIEKVHP